MNLNAIQTNTRNASLVVGAGITGLSCLRYLERKGVSAKLYDDVLSEDKLQKIRDISHDITVFDRASNIEDILNNVSILLLSPGIALDHPLVAQAQAQSLELIGDVELFARENTKPVMAVTGSNAKSTVVTLLSLMAKADGKKVALAGNIGRPLLDSLYEDDSDLYVLELSSFQLDITETLKTKVSCILNISPDHLDRYDSYQAYADSKQKIYKNSQIIVCNRADALTYPQAHSKASVVSFGLDKPEASHFGLNSKSGITFLACGDQNIIDSGLLAKQGVTDIQNALAAMAIAHAAGISYSAITDVLKTFQGLPHRCELISQFNKVKWVNDSKGTNVGATQAAIESVAKGSDGKTVILIAGGDSKEGDLSLLSDNIQRHVKTILLIGKDAQLFKNMFESITPCVMCNSLEETILQANKLAKEGDTVLLSPACSSLDMFKNYQDRGEQFKQGVLALETAL